MTRLVRCFSLARGRMALRRFGRAVEGVAAVEFALIAPIMMLCFIGTVEMSQAISVTRRTSQVGSSIGDMAARQSASVTVDYISGIMSIGSYLYAPYDGKPLKVTLRKVRAPTATATIVDEAWNCQFDANQAIPNGLTYIPATCTCSAAAPYPQYTLATKQQGLMTSAADEMLVADVTYAYKPLVFDFFLKRTMTANGAGAYTFSDQSNLKPRSGSPRLTLTNGTQCS